MNEVDVQTFTLSLYELQFQVWFNSVEFEQSYWAFSYSWTRLMNRPDELVWWTRLMHRLFAEVYMSLSFKFGWILSIVMELLVTYEKSWWLQQAWWTSLMKEVDTQIYSLSPYELKFQVWLNSLEFEQSYWALCYLWTKLMNRYDEHVWWMRLIHRLLA